MRSFFLFAIVMLSATGGLSGEPSMQNPLIKDYGGIVVLPDAAEPPREETKALLDVASDEKRGTVLKGLDRAASIVNLYEQAGAGPTNGLKLAVVIHGSATSAVLRSDAYSQHIDEGGNPNLELIDRLRQAGVEVYVCGQALARQGFRTDEVAPGVVVAVSAAIVHINRQMDGYHLIP